MDDDQYIKVCSTKEDLIKEICSKLPSLRREDIMQIAKFYNSLIPCKRCGKPVGEAIHSRRQYCPECSEKIHKKNITEAVRRWNRRHRLRFIHDRYSDFLINVPIDHVEIYKSIDEILRSGKNYGYSKLQIVSAGIIYTVRRLKLPYTISNIAKWLGCHNKKISKLWWEIKDCEPFRSAHLDYLRWKQDAKKNIKNG